MPAPGSGARSKTGKTVTIAGNAASDANDCEEESHDLKSLSRSTRPDALGRLGHYEMLHVLGRGAFGIVFRAFGDLLKRVVAVKVMAPQKRPWTGPLPISGQVTRKRRPLPGDAIVR
jgi:hypothetical protein